MKFVSLFFIALILMSCGRQTPKDLTGPVFGNDGYFDGVVFNVGGSGGSAFKIDKDTIQYSFVCLPGEGPPVMAYAFAADKVIHVVRSVDGKLWQVESWRYFYSDSGKFAEWLQSDDGEGSIKVKVVPLSARTIEQ